MLNTFMSVIVRAILEFCLKCFEAIGRVTGRSSVP